MQLFIQSILYTGALHEIEFWKELLCSPIISLDLTAAMSQGFIIISIFQIRKQAQRG